MHGTFPSLPSQGPRLKVLLLLGSWVSGGAERVALHLLNNIDAARYEVKLGLLHSPGTYLDELDRDRVLVAENGDRNFAFEGRNRQIFTPMKLLRGAIHGPLAFRRMVQQIRPDVVVSFLKGTAVLTWLALAGLKHRPRWIAREGNNVMAVADDESPNKAVKGLSLWLTRQAYRRADAVIANSSDMAAALIADLGVDPGRTHTINNPVDVDRIKLSALKTVADLPERPFILTAGRLEYQKAHETLIRGFAKSGTWRSHDLVILGEGSRFAMLRQLAMQLGIGDQVRFIGFVGNPHAWMARADLFVLSSRWEGFPNAAAEALAAGVPLLMTDCRFGPRDLIEPGVSGELIPVDDIPALARAIVDLIGDPARRDALKQAGKLRVRHFARDAMLGRYANLFDHVADGMVAG